MTEDVAAESAPQPEANDAPEVEATDPVVEGVAQDAPALPDASAVETPAESITQQVGQLEEPAALSLASQVEALLYASGEPASLAALAGALDATNGEIEAALEELTSLYAVRGIRLQRSGNKVQLVTAPEIAAKVQKFLGLEEVNRLSSAALETLAIIAYNQPITRPQVEMIRGVNCDGVITTLIARNLIQELGRAETVGHPMRYGVSFEFLQYFGLRNVHELPPVEKLDTLPVGKSEMVDAPAETASVANEMPPEALAEDETPAEIADIVETTAGDAVINADERLPVEPDGSH